MSSNNFKQEFGIIFTFQMKESVCVYIHMHVYKDGKTRLANWSVSIKNGLGGGYFFPEHQEDSLQITLYEWDFF